MARYLTKKGEKVDVSIEWGHWGGAPIRPAIAILTRKRNLESEQAMEPGE
jgi:hypothetical protein